MHMCKKKCNLCLICIWKIKLKVGHVNLFRSPSTVFPSMGGLEPSLAQGGGTTWTCVQFITGLILTLTLTLLFTLTPTINWESPIHRACMSLDCRRRQNQCCTGLQYIHSCLACDTHWVIQGTVKDTHLFSYSNQKSTPNSQYITTPLLRERTVSIFWVTWKQLYICLPWQCPMSLSPRYK